MSYMKTFRVAMGWSRREYRWYIHLMEQGEKHCSRILDRTNPNWRQELPGKSLAYYLFDDYSNSSLKEIKLINKKKLKLKNIL